MLPVFALSGAAVRKALLCVMFSIAALSASRAAALDDDLAPAKTLGPVTIRVYQEAGLPGSVHLSNGTVISTDQYGQPLMKPLARALNLAQAGDVIACRGELDGVQIGKYDPNKPFAVFRGNGEVISDVSIVSEDPQQPCIIRGVVIMGNVQVAGGHGVDDLTFKDIVFKNNPGSPTPILVAMDGAQGLLRFYNIRLVSGDPASYSGFGMKWGMRANSAATYDIRGFSCAKAQEHCLYLDSIGGGVGGDSYFLDVRQRAPSGRTGIQVVTRADPIHGSLGLPSQGDLYIRRSRLKTNPSSGGGSALTVAGHLGRVFVYDLQYRGSAGAVAFWTDAGKGVHTTPEGYSTPFARLENIRVVSPQADRSHIQISGVGLVQIKRFLVRGNRAAFDFENLYGGPLPNGTVQFLGAKPLSANPGFKSGTKIRLQNQTLSNQQIDSLFP